VNLISIKNLIFEKKKMFLLGEDISVRNKKVSVMGLSKSGANVLCAALKDVADGFVPLLVSTYGYHMLSCSWCVCFVVDEVTLLPDVIVGEGKSRTEIEDVIDCHRSMLEEVFKQRAPIILVCAHLSAQRRAVMEAFGAHLKAIAIVEMPSLSKADCSDQLWDLIKNPQPRRNETKCTLM
jgi:hypothetical protein